MLIFSFFPQEIENAEKIPVKDIYEEDDQEMQVEQRHGREVLNMKYFIEAELAAGWNFFGISDPDSTPLNGNLKNL